MKLIQSSKNVGEKEREGIFRKIAMQAEKNREELIRVNMEQEKMEQRQRKWKGR